MATRSSRRRSRSRTSSQASRRAHARSDGEAIGSSSSPRLLVPIRAEITLLAAGPSVAQATTMSESSMRGGDAHHGGAGDHPRSSGGDHHGDWDHHSRHHFGGRPNGIYYVYPWVYRYYPVP